MKFIVYGTLKRGYGNNRLLANATFVKEITVPGYRLLNAGFPVAIPHEESSLLGELWETLPDDKQTVQWLDRLENEGRMYNRVEVEENIFMYVGHPSFWNKYQLNECPNRDGVYIWNND